MSVPATRDVPAPEAGLAPVEDVRLAPAWESISLPGAAERTATVICDLLKGEVPWEHCPRSYLKRMIARLHAQGLDLHIGFEIEFYLLRPQEEAPFPPPVDDLAYAQSLAGQISHEEMAEIALDLWRRGIPVAQYLAEGGPGQQEITLEHCGPLLLADRLIQAREIIHAVALKHGLQATFLPKPFPEQAGSGLHTHFSLWQEGANHTCAVGEAWDLTRETNAFMAGILNHLPALMAVTTPTRSSFRRIQPHAWSGAYQAWGIGNKEAALRVISDARSGRPSNVELKTVDGSANPYLALGGLIAAGLEGIKKGMHLPPPVEQDPADYSAAEREALHIAPLPAAAEEALGHFMADNVLQAAMGVSMAAVFAAVRRAELQSLAGCSFEEERRLLFQRY